MHVCWMTNRSTGKPSGQLDGRLTVTPKSLFGSANRAVDRCLMTSSKFLTTGRLADRPMSGKTIVTANFQNLGLLTCSPTGIFAPFGLDLLPNDLMGSSNSIYHMPIYIAQ